MSRKTGRIKKYISTRGFGFIETEEDPNNFFFHISSTRYFDGDPREGEKVTFRTRKGRDGKPAAVDVQPLAAQENEPSYRFLNPYNFVRWLPARGEGKAAKQTKTSETALGAALLAAGASESAAPEPTSRNSRLLGRCAPPPHDRWVGLSGKITCEIQAMTPLFVSDSDPEPQHQTDADKKVDHRTHSFFKYNFGDGEKHAIPAASLRGMIRNVFETVTNSCYAHFDYDKRLSYHLPAGDAQKLVPARIEKSDDGKSAWQLRLLPGDARLSIGSRPGKLYAARLEQYRSLGAVWPKKKEIPPPKGRVGLDGKKHGKRCFGRARPVKFGWEIVELADADAKDELTKNMASDEKIFEGYLCLN